MTIRPRFVFLALWCGIISTACASAMAPALLLDKMREGAAPLIVDVRSQGEYDQDHLPGAVHIPFFRIGSGLHARGYLKKEPLILYCEHGPRAGIAVFSLYLSGYEQVYVLEGHMKAWRENNYPVEIIHP